MKVRALCNIFYNGKMYAYGEIIETDKPLPNTEPTEREDFPDREQEGTDPEEFGRQADSYPDEQREKPDRRHGRGAREQRGDYDDR